MRIVAGCLVFFAIAAVRPQSSAELHALYGEPDVERFAVRLGIRMTVEYGPDRLPCKMMIAATSPLAQGEPGDEAMSVELTREILDEVVPSHVRGLALGNQLSQMSRIGQEIRWYENVNITLDEVMEVPPIVSNALVTFKRAACQNLAESRVAP